MIEDLFAKLRSFTAVFACLVPGVVWQDVRLRVDKGHAISLATHCPLEPAVFLVLATELVQVMPQGGLSLPILQPCKRKNIWL